MPGAAAWAVAAVSNPCHCNHRCPEPVVRSRSLYSFSSPSLLLYPNLIWISVIRPPKFSASLDKWSSWGCRDRTRCPTDYSAVLLDIQNHVKRLAAAQRDRVGVVVGVVPRLVPAAVWHCIQRHACGSPREASVAIP